MLELLETLDWLMTGGERAALEGVVSQLEPDLAIEIGTAEGGSLRRIAAHAHEVHSFDLVRPAGDLAELPNVTLHTGDSHELLPRVLEAFAAEQRNVDFVLVDGDHTANGVRRDVEHLLRSAAVSRTVIMCHDTANEAVRAGLGAIRFDEWPKVSFVDLDFVPGYLMNTPERFHHEIWGGLGLIVVDDSDEMRERLRRDPELKLGYPASEVLAAYRATLASGDAQSGSDAVVEYVDTLARLRNRLNDVERELSIVTNSRSSQMTAPLRRLAATVRRRM